MWTAFWDMHSGGGTKEPPYEMIYIEAPKEEAKIIFYNRFGHNPERVTCTCCGSDYSIDESPTLEQATGFHRGCDYVYLDSDGNEVPITQAWRTGVGLLPGFRDMWVERPASDPFRGMPYMTLDEYLASGKVLVIRADEIRQEERVGEVPEQGYVWVN